MRDLRRPRRRFWTPEEDNELLQLSAQRRAPHRIAHELGRTKLAIEMRLAVLKHPSKRPQRGHNVEAVRSAKISETDKDAGQ